MQKIKFDLKLRETKSVGANRHHATINFVYKILLTTQIMQQAIYLGGGASQ
jgi:hypothetical protein